MTEINEENGDSVEQETTIISNKCWLSSSNCTILIQQIVVKFR